MVAQVSVKSEKGVYITQSRRYSGHGKIRYCVHEHEVAEGLVVLRIVSCWQLHLFLNVIQVMCSSLESCWAFFVHMMAGLQCRQDTRNIEELTSLRLRRLAGSGVVKSGDAACPARRFADILSELSSKSCRKLLGF